MGLVTSRVASSCPIYHIAQVVFHLWDLPEVDLLAFSHTIQCQLYCTLGMPLPLGALGLNAFNYPWKYWVSYAFPSPALVPLVLSNFMAEYVTGQFRLLILVVLCWMEAPWLPTILNMLADVPRHCPVVKDIIMDLQWSTSNFGKQWAGWCVQEGVPNNAISAPKWTDFLEDLFRVGLAWCTVCIYHSAISAFLETHHHHKASNHPIISKWMHHFYLQCLPSHKCFDPFGCFIVGELGTNFFCHYF